jgi:phosphonate degradation associated HDIG domain protein
MEQDRNSAAENTVREVTRLFEDRGAEWYGGERVSQLQHALQAATFAERASSPAPLIVAALLHDVGHLLHDLPEDAAEQGVDDRHQTLASQWLSRRFGQAVVAPIEMHVAAKRYLCATDPGYAARLSPSSVTSLKLQGGPMSREEVDEFQRRAHFADAVRLRRWDDAAKQVDLETPPLEHFAAQIRRAVQEAEA